jgi:uncharacterized protein YaiE (UPF0345 family)
MEEHEVSGHDFSRADKGNKEVGVLTPAGWFFGNFTPLDEFFRSPSGP